MRQYEILLENLKTTEFKTRKIALPNHHGSINFYPLESIVFCTSASVDQSEGAYTIFHFVNKDKVVASRTLGHYESLLREYDFERSERGYLINMTYVKSLRRNGTEITLEHYPEEKLPVLRKRRESFEARLRAFRQGWL